jgi:hypothetical protein
MLNVPHAPRALRWGIVLLGAIAFLWLSVEDTAVTSVAALGSTLALHVSLMQLWRRIGGRTLSSRYVPIGATLFGAGVGSLSVISTVALMFLKTALHSHVFPDYPPLQMLAMLERLPAWAAAGALIGLGVALVIVEIGTPIARNN